MSTPDDLPASRLPAPHHFSYTGHMQTVNTMAPLHSLAFCLYFLSQNDGYKSQSGRNKNWCKAQISFPEDWVNWPGGLVKRQKAKKYSAGERKSIITGPPQLRACAKALITSSRPPGPCFHCAGQSAALLSWFQICVVLPGFMGKSASVNTWVET